MKRYADREQARAVLNKSEPQSFAATRKNNYTVVVVFTEYGLSNLIGQALCFDLGFFREMSPEGLLAVLGHKVSRDAVF